MRSVLTLIFCVCVLGSGFSQTVSILIDAGHGGKDPGHLSNDGKCLQEKHLTLQIALRVGSYLEKYLQNVEVGYTRTDDSYPSLEERVEQANSGYNYMLSVHVNGSPNANVYGTETLIHNYDAKTSHDWGKLIEHQFKKRARRKSRGVKTKEDLGHSLQILKFTKIPTIIVECGFITNTIEAQYLTSIYGQEIIASAIFRGTREFFQSKHPDIEFIPQESEDNQADDEEKESCYRIQIMSSIDTVALDIPQFKKLKHPVERVEVESKSLYKYKYYVGRFDTKREAKDIHKEVRDNGFKDAFIVFIQ